jgi:hypothetical protein
VGSSDALGAIDLVALERLCMLHCTDQEIASYFGVTTERIEQQRQSPKFVAVMEGPSQREDRDPAGADAAPVPTYSLLLNHADDQRPCGDQESRSVCGQELGDILALKGRLGMKPTSVLLATALRVDGGVVRACF